MLSLVRNLVARIAALTQIWNFSNYKFKIYGGVTFNLQIAICRMFSLCLVSTVNSYSMFWSCCTLFVLCVGPL